MEDRINSVTNSGVVSDDVRTQHKGFSEWNGKATRSDHQPIVQVNPNSLFSMTKK
jgi:hypothetical protein